MCECKSVPAGKPTGTNVNFSDISTSIMLPPHYNSWEHSAYSHDNSHLDHNTGLLRQT